MTQHIMHFRAERTEDGRYRIEVAMQSEKDQDGLGMIDMHGVGTVKEASLIETWTVLKKTLELLTGENQTMVL